MTSLTMSVKEMDRLSVITKLLTKHLTAPEAAEQLDLSVRQVKRIKKRVKKHGAKGLVHRGRGAASNRKLDNTFVENILHLLRSVYVGYGPTLAAEKLLERDHMKISDEALRAIMIANNLWKAKSRKKQTASRVAAASRTLWFNGTI